MDFPGGSDGKVSAYNARDSGSTPGLGRSSGEGNGNPLQYSCLKNPMDGGVLSATVHGVAKSQTRLSDCTFYCGIEWFALEMNRDHSVIFEIASKYCILDSFVDYDGYSISSNGFLPTVVDIMVI